MNNIYIIAGALAVLSAGAKVKRITDCEPFKKCNDVFSRNTDSNITQSKCNSYKLYHPCILQAVEKCGIDKDSEFKQILQSGRQECLRDCSPDECDTDGRGDKTRDPVSGRTKSSDPNGPDISVTANQVDNTGSGATGDDFSAAGGTGTGTVSGKQVAGIGTSGSGADITRRNASPGGTGIGQGQIPRRSVQPGISEGEGLRPGTNAEQDTAAGRNENAGDDDEGDGTGQGQEGQGQGVDRGSETKRDVAGDEGRPDAFEDDEREGDGSNSDPTDNAVDYDGDNDGDGEDGEDGNEDNDYDNGDDSNEDRNEEGDQPVDDYGEEQITGDYNAPEPEPTNSTMNTENNTAPNTGITLSCIASSFSFFLIARSLGLLT